MPRQTVTTPDAGGEVNLRQLQAGEAAALQRFYNTLCEESRQLFRPLGWTATLAQCEQVVTEALSGSRREVTSYPRLRSPAATNRTTTGCCGLAENSRLEPQLGFQLNCLPAEIPGPLPRAKRVFAKDVRAVAKRPLD